jgi:hypothetical protein
MYARASMRSVWKRICKARVSQHAVGGAAARARTRRDRYIDRGAGRKARKGVCTLPRARAQLKGACAR